MAQVSRRTRIIRRLLVAVLVASVMVATVAIKNRITQADVPPPPPAPTSSSSIDAPTPTETSVSAEPAKSTAPHKNHSPGSSGTVADPQSSLALIISLITSVTSVLGLLMSKYTEWQRSRLEQMKLAIELQQKELELQELRRKLQNV